MFIFNRPLQAVAAGIGEALLIVCLDRMTHPPGALPDVQAGSSVPAHRLFTYSSTLTRGNPMTQPEPIQVGQLNITYLIDGTMSGGMGVFELTIPPGSNVPPPHSHSKNDECVYVLEGILRYSVDNATRDLRPGEWMFSPKGSVHQFSNPHKETTRVLTILNPDIGAQYFRDVGSVINAGGPPDRVRLVSVCPATVWSLRRHVPNLSSRRCARESI